MSPVASTEEVDVSAERHGGKSQGR